MARDKEVRVKIRALDRISKVIDKVRKKFPQFTRSVRRASRFMAVFNAQTSRFRKGMGRFGRAMSGAGRKMTTGLTVPIGIAGFAILRTGVMFQKAINKVGAVTGTIKKNSKGLLVVSDNFKTLEERALTLGRTTEFSSTQAAKAMALLGRAGFKTGEILASTSDVLALASANGEDLAFTADVMAKTIRQFGLEATDAQRVSDVLSQAARSANVDLQTLAETFKFAAPIAKAYGATLEQTAAITGLLGDVGIQGSLAGTALKNIFIKLAAPSKKAAEFMSQMGVATTTASGEMKTAGKIFAEIAPLIGKLNKDKQLMVVNELFGLRGIAGASALMAKKMKEGGDPIKKMTELLKDSVGAAKEMQEIMLIGAPGALARFQSAAEGLALAFNKSGLLDMFASILGDITKLISALSSVNPVILKTVTIIAGIAAVIGPVLASIGFMAAGIAKLTVAWGAMKACAIALAPILALITIKFVLIAAAVIVVIRLIQKFSEMISAFKKTEGFFAGLKSAGKVFLGIDNDGEAETTTGSVAPAGAPLGASRAMSSAGPMFSQQIQTNNAAIRIDFANAPKGTKVRSEASGPLELNLGFAGGIL